MKRWFGTFLVLCAVILLLPTPRAHAQPGSGTALPGPVLTAPPAAVIAVTQPITGTPELTGSLRIATTLATHFGRSVQEILDLRAAEWGFGNIARALFTALEAGISLEQVLQLRDQDIGWGEIRQSLGLAAGMPRQSLGQIVGRGHNGPDWAPPGQAKKQGEDMRAGGVPPGQAKKQGADPNKGSKP